MEQSGARHPHKVEVAGSSPARATEMQIVMYTGRPKPLFWVEGLCASPVITGQPMHIVASTREQAERTFTAVKSLLNGRDPQGTAPG